MDFLKVAVVIAFIILTVFTVKFPPEIHQPFILEDSDFVLTRISDTITVDNVPVASVSNNENVGKITVEQAKETAKVIENMANKQEPVKIVSEPVNKQKNVSKTVQTSEPKKTVVEVKTSTNPQNQSQIELLQKILTNAENAQVVEQPVNQGTKTVTQPKTSTQTKTVQQPQPKTQPQTKTVETSQPKSSSNPYMTEQEEIIAWNIWRSNIQNQIMRDSNIDFAPLGTVFTFTFVVDKFGNVSNIKVECSNPSFMDVARNNVKPAIANLQKKPILNFPKGTKRTSTVVTGMFLIGTQTRYSTPANYSDYETVRY